MTPKEIIAHLRRRCVRRDVVEAVEQLAANRLLMAKLAADTPQFFNPLVAIVARAKRDEVLREAAVEP